VLDVLAAPPNRQDPPQTIRMQRLPRDHVINGDRETCPADNLPRKRRDVFQKRYPSRQIAALCEEVGQRRRCCDDDQIANPKV
jgi:hypothetical protein